MKVALVLLAALAITICEHRSLAQTSSALIEAGLEETFSVECYAFGNGSIVQKNYGIWDMQVHLLQILQLSPVNSDTSEMACHFVWISGTSTVHQDFAVFLASGMAFACGDVCHWTVYSDGFYLFNPATREDTLLYQWLSGEDTWVRPS